MKVLVTGATGFIGSRLIEHAAFDYRAVVRRENASRCADQYLISNIDEDTDWTDALDAIEAVVHLAGLAHKPNSTAEEFFSINHKATVNLARQCAERGVKRFVHVSSISVNGRGTCGTPFSENTKEHPYSDSAVSKHRAETDLNAIGESTELEIVNIRPVLVYGCNAPGNMGSLSKLVRSVPCLPFGVLKNRRSFISIGNLIDFIRTCIEHPEAANQTFVIADSEAVSTRQFLDALAKGLGKNLIQLPVPVSVLKGLGTLTGKSAQIELLLGDLEVDIDKANQVLGWKPPRTMDEAMRELSTESTVG